MNKSNKPVIQYASLDLGFHQFDFELDNSFFIEQGYCSFLNCVLKVNIGFMKDESLMTLNTNIVGYVEVECDRCLEMLKLPVSVVDQLFVKIGDDNNNEDESIIFVTKDDSLLDLSSYLYDLTLVNLPVRKVHPDDENGNSTCNAEQIKRLEQYKKQNTVDPRWEVLKQFKEE